MNRSENVSGNGSAAAEPRVVNHPDRTLITASPADRAWFGNLVQAAQTQAATHGLPDLRTLRHAMAEAAHGPSLRPVPPNVALSQQDAGGIAAWWFRPENSRRTAPLMYFHGGGYVCGSVETSRGIAAALAVAFNAPVLAVGYRQAPEHPFPAAIEDAWASFSWLAGTCREPITLVGDSAGGNLAVVTAARAGRETPRKVRTAIASSAWLDVWMSASSWTRHPELDLGPLELGIFFRDSYLGPRHTGPLPRPASEGELAGCPPLLVQIGSVEGGFDDSESLVAAARRAGVLVRFEVYEPMPHNFCKFARPIADFAIARMAAWDGDLQAGRPLRRDGSAHG